MVGLTRSLIKVGSACAVDWTLSGRAETVAGVFASTSIPWIDDSGYGRWFAGVDTHGRRITGSASASLRYGSVQRGARDLQTHEA